jgi:hypothetical protein
VYDDDGRPRHRKTGRARKRRSGSPGRHLRLVADPSCEFDDLPPPGAYPVEDLAAMSASAAEMLLHRARIEAESDTATIPHILITRDTETGTVTRSGPFETGLEALTMAHDFVGRYRDLEPRWAFTVTVAPLLPE